MHLINEGSSTGEVTPGGFEHEFFQLLRQVPTAVAIVHGTDHVYVFTNPVYQHIFSRAEHDLIGRPVKEVWPALTGEGLQELLDQVFATGEPIELKAYPLSFSLKTGYYDITAKPVNIPGDIKRGIMIHVLDVTESVEAKRTFKRTTAEQALKQSEQRFQAAMAAVQGILWTNNARGEMEGEQSGWSKLTGQRYEEYQGHGWAKAVHPEDAQPTIDAWSEAVREKKAFVFEHRLQRKDGSWGRYCIHAIPLLNEDDSIREWVGVHTDVTEQRNAEGRFRLIAEQMPQLIYMLTADGNIEFVSKNWIDYSGIEDPRTAWQWMVHPDDWDRVMDNWSLNLISQLPFKEELRLRNKHGEYRWHYSIIQPIRDHNNQLIKWVGALTDIHEQKTFAGQLEKEVATRISQLKRSNDDLLQFAHVASHDLKEPVRKIMTFVDLLKTMHMQDNAALYLSKVEKSAGRMKTMIDGVLLYSSLTASEQKIQDVDLNEVMQQISEELEVLIESKNAVLHWNSLPVIPGSFILLYQLFYNLVSNSLKFVKKDVPPKITVTHAAMDKNEWQPDTSLKYVNIMVSDNGIGFNQKDAEIIFSSFTRLNSKDEFEGTGLGLTLCRKIVERHGGRMYAAGEKDAGAVFTISLPY